MRLRRKSQAHGGRPNRSRSRLTIRMMQEDGSSAIKLPDTRKCHTPRKGTHEKEDIVKGHLETLADVVEDIADSDCDSTPVDQLTITHGSGIQRSITPDLNIPLADPDEPKVSVTDTLYRTITEAFQGTQEILGIPTTIPVSNLTPPRYPLPRFQAFGDLTTPSKRHNFKPLQILPPVHHEKNPIHVPQSSAPPIIQVPFYASIRATPISTHQDEGALIT
ncbi:hypothetical protein L6452_18242 [Arctium lappa]|uniref:Uncharacterized protein n=1 Tax=Arctium lappa TaxID=4217 RepID=A0ACB9C5P0_ARCLA|nr:hypothetical protein L6452_18242 [Arctium lappa]